MLKPKKLEREDRLAAVTLSWGGPGEMPDRYALGKRRFEEAFGVTIVETTHARKPAAWIAKNPQARADDLMAAFADPAIKGILTTVGGDDSIRTLPYLDLDVIRRNPKIFLGFSDATVTHFACLKAGLVSFYGPSLMAGFAREGALPAYLEHSLRKTLFADSPIGAIRPNPEGWSAEHLFWMGPDHPSGAKRLNAPEPWRVLQGKGIARGRLLGGCVDVLERLKTTTYWPDLTQWEDAILFLEISEDKPVPERFADWLRDYGTRGILSRLSGILFGRPGGTVPEAEFGAYEEALSKVVGEEFGLPNLPILARLDFGHTEPAFTIPIGVPAEIHCDQGSLFIPENAVV